MYRLETTGEHKTAYWSGLKWVEKPEGAKLYQDVRLAAAAAHELTVRNKVKPIQPLLIRGGI